jgi:hypothetical protein
MLRKDTMPAIERLQTDLFFCFCTFLTQIGDGCGSQKCDLL